jgi:hypothetical protein
MSEDRILAAKAKVQRLLDINVIREAMYSEGGWVPKILTPRLLFRISSNLAQERR